SPPRRVSVGKIPLRECRGPGRRAAGGRGTRASERGRGAGLATRAGIGRDPYGETGASAARSAGTAADAGAQARSEAPPLGGRRGDRGRRLRVRAGGVDARSGGRRGGDGSTRTRRPRTRPQ